MGQILRLVSVGALALLILLPLWSGGSIVSLAMNAKDGNMLSRIGLPPDFDDGVIARLQDMRSEIRDQQCARRAQRYCLLGRCWTIDAPRNCAAPSKTDAGPAQLSAGR